MTNISIVVISDNVCPFCYIGLAHLTRALTLYRKVIPGGSTDTITTRWHAHQLDPSASGSQPLTAKITSRFGPDGIPAREERLRCAGLNDGIVFSTESRIGNTRDSHRVVQLARARYPELETEVVREIMRMYFEEGGDITAWEDLGRAAARAGIPEGEVRAWLEGGMGGEEVDREVEEAKKMGVNGVPRYIINDKFVVDGAEDVNSFLEQLTLAKEDADKADHIAA